MSQSTKPPSEIRPVKAWTARLGADKTPVIAKRWNLPKQHGLSGEYVDDRVYKITDKDFETLHEAQRWMPSGFELKILTVPSNRRLLVDIVRIPETGSVLPVFRCPWKDCNFTCTARRRVKNHVRGPHKGRVPAGVTSEMGHVTCGEGPGGYLPRQPPPDWYRQSLSGAEKTWFVGGVVVDCTEGEEADENIDGEDTTAADPADDDDEDDDDDADFGSIQASGSADFGGSQQQFFRSQQHAPHQGYKPRVQYPQGRSYHSPMQPPLQQSVIQNVYQRQIPLRYQAQNEPTWEETQNFFDQVLRNAGEGLQGEALFTHGQQLNNGHQSQRPYGRAAPSSGTSNHNPLNPNSPSHQNQEEDERGPRNNSGQQAQRGHAP